MLWWQVAYHWAKQKTIKRGMQASMTGQVAGELTYETWLKTKSVSIQKEVLGDGVGNYGMMAK